MIRFRDDRMGGGDTMDVYNLYPIRPDESPEERTNRLIRIKYDDLQSMLTSASDKKEWLIKELVRRNDMILQTLETILKEYEKTPEENWPELDSNVLKITERSTARDLLRCFGLDPHYSSADINGQVFAADISQFSFTASPEGTKTVSEPKDTWICSACGAEATGKFCPACGMPCPGL